MSSSLERMSWKFAVGGAAVLAGMLTRSVLGKGWKGIKKTDPPLNPESRHVSWGDALLWTALTGAAAGVARLLAARGTAAGWERITGATPPDE